MIFVLWQTKKVVTVICFRLRCDCNNDAAPRVNVIKLTVTNLTTKMYGASGSDVIPQIEMFSEAMCSVALAISRHGKPGMRWCSCLIEIRHWIVTADRYYVRHKAWAEMRVHVVCLFVFFSLFSFTIFLFAHLPRTFLAVHCAEKVRDFINVTSGFAYNWTLGS